MLLRSSVVIVNAGVIVGVVDITSCCQHRALLLGPRAIAGIVGVIVDITHVMLALWAVDITLYCWHCIVDIVDYCWHRGLLLASWVIVDIAGC